MEPQERIAAGARHEVGHPDLVAAVRAGHDRERPGLAGRGVAARPLGGVRPAPVQDLVLEMRDRGERAGAPAEDALVDLEAAPDEPASSSGRTGRRPCSGRAARRPGRRARRRDRPAAARRHPARRRTGGRRRRGWPGRGPPGRPRSTSRAGSSAVPRPPVRGRTAGRGRPPDRTAAARGRTRTRARSGRLPAPPWRSGCGRCRRSGPAGWSVSSGRPATRRRDNVLTGHRPDASIVQTVAQEAVDARSNPRRPSVMTRPAVRANGSSPARARPSRRSGSRPEARSTTDPSAPSPVPCGSDVA